MHVLCFYMHVFMKIEKEKIEKIRDFIKDETGSKIIISQGRYYPKDIPDFVMLFQAITKQFVLGLTPSSCKILLYMFSKLQYSNHIGIDQLTISEECKICIRAVAKSIKELTDQKIIISYQYEADRRRKIYIINPFTAWKGTFNERKKAIKSIHPDQLQLPFPTTTSGSSDAS